MSCKVGETLRGNSSEYNILEFIGEGGFGKVAKCQKVATKETVAVKILKKNPQVMKYAEREVTMLQLISGMNPDKTNVVKFLEMFQHEGEPCLAFEMLQIDLFHLMKEDHPVCLNAIRPIAKQLMVALDALQGLGILHTDIKTDNIMLASLDLPVRVKLIDFGIARRTSDTWCGQTLQIPAYRAPEVFLGLPLTGAIDVWSVGCVLRDLFLATNFFSFTEYDMFRFMIGLLGQPEDHLLRAGKHTHKYFTEVSTKKKKGQAKEHETWRLLTPEEYYRKNQKTPKETISDDEIPDSLDTLISMYPLEDGAAEFEDRFAFVDFLKQLLQLDPAKRITPSQAQQHTFINMSHLSKHTDNKDYLMNARKMMGISPNPDQEPFSGSHQHTNITAPSSTVSERNSGSKDKDDGPTVESPDGPTVESPDGPTVESPNGPTVESADGPTAESPDGPTVESADGPTVESPNGPTVESADGPTAESPDGPTVESADGPTAESPDGPTVESADGPTVESTDGAPGQYTLEELSAYLLKDYSKYDFLFNGEVTPSRCFDGKPTPSTQAYPDGTGVVPQTRPSTSFKMRLVKGIRNFCRGVKKAFCCCCQVEDD